MSLNKYMHVRGFLHKSEIALSSPLALFSLLLNGDHSISVCTGQETSLPFLAT